MSNHQWQDTSLWGKKSIFCEKCNLYIIDCYMGSSNYDTGEYIRWQISNVLNLGFDNRTKEEIISLAEADGNNECNHGKWLDTRIIKAKNIIVNI